MKHTPSFLAQIEFLGSETAIAAASNTEYVVDLQGKGRHIALLLHIATFGVTPAATLNIKTQESDLAASGFVDTGHEYDIDNTTVDAGGNSGPDTLHWLDFGVANKRYLKFVFDAGIEDTGATVAAVFTSPKPDAGYGLP